MAARDLEELVIRTLTRLGRAKIVDAAPEMQVLFNRQQYTIETVARVILDASNIVLLPEDVWNLFKMVQEVAKSGQLFVVNDNREELENLLWRLDDENRSVLFKSTAGMLITNVGGSFTIAAADQPVLAHVPNEHARYFRVIGALLGRNGPALHAVDALSTTPQGRRDRLELTTTFAGSILNLWRQILRAWSTDTFLSKQEDSPEIGVCKTNGKVRSR
jgi:hypothetical protein